MNSNEQASKKSKHEGSEMKFSWKPQPILAEDLTRRPGLEKAFIGILKDKRNISKAISCLTKCLPCPQYLKRCSGLRIYLVSIDKVNSNPDNLNELLVQNGFDLSLLEDEYEVAEVLSAAPKTKSQAAYACKFWPINFHPDVNLEALISGSLFDDAQLASLEICMKLAISVAAEVAVGSSECNGSALIIDPEEGSILAMAASSSDQHPMWHASMLAVDLVARLQGGGAWKLIQDPVHEDDIVKRKHQEFLPLRYPDSLASIEVPMGGSLYFAKRNEKSKDTKKELSEKCGPYLCTGYWAILLQEPCPLCAMALLHSRVSRIFYGAANLQTGILGSRAALHSVPGVNHRYQVWSSVLEDECVRTLKRCRRIDN